MLSTPTCWGGEGASKKSNLGREYDTPLLTVQGDVMLPGARATVDVDPIVISSNPKQLSALRNLMAELRQAQDQLRPAFPPGAQAVAGGHDALGHQLTPEVKLPAAWLPVCVCAFLPI